MDNLIEIISADGVFALRLFVAMILGGAIGFERKTRGRPAGLRTNILVCLGSAAVIVAFQKLYSMADPGSASAIRIDPARAAAGVITGIGFLGAGTIVKSDSVVHGLTTAASIWVVSAVGITVGLGEFTIAIMVTVLVLMTLFGLHRVNISTDQYSALVLDWDGELSVVDDVIGQLERTRAHIKQRSVVRHPGSRRCRATLTIRYRDESSIRAIVDALQSDERFRRVSWN